MAALEARRAQIDARRAEILRTRAEVKVVGPSISLGAAAAATGILAATGVTLAIDTEAGPTAQTRRRYLPPWLGGAAVTSAVALGSGIWLKRRVKRRRAHKPELAALQHEQTMLTAQLMWRERGFCQPPDARTLRLQLAPMDARLAELQRQRAELSLAGPIAMVATGGAITVASALGLGVAVLQMADYRDHGDPIPSRLLNQRLAFGIAGLAGLGLATGGMAWGFKRRRARRALMPEMRALTRERRALDPVLVTPVVGPSSLGLVVGMKF